MDGADGLGTEKRAGTKAWLLAHNVGWLSPVPGTVATARRTATDLGQALAYGLRCVAGVMQTGGMVLRR